MRTTVTIDPDVERLLRQAMHRSRKGFKATLNSAVRAGLASGKTVAASPVALKARPMRLRAGIDPARLQELADELEIQSFLAKNKRLGRK